MLRRAVAGLAALVALTGCEITEADPAPAPAGPTPLAVLSAAEAARALDGLRVADRSPAVASYDRDAFGSAWADTDGNGCNQRDDVLLRDAVAGSTVVAQQGRCDHDVLAGTWIDPSTGRTLVFDDLKDPAQAQAVQIDHVVPLAEAWRSGADSWTDARRRAFANDLAVLQAADGPTNAAKSDDDPAAWRPRRAQQCAYAAHWIAVKAAWSLSADRSEVAALREMLGTC
ncbi:HNH endonuclease family protein [Nocardioides lianchengensis]|uniref:GmrSD restriction endonucleases C-terminal domain-containing protein n=1 Tax=Nocardioides lianchengensis TaxID=1045774 RepID=A0A1G6X9U8_9ACTN|nr:HNH endonuclease family protein [Nocardioides lianchengensis]NYG09052.1 hypothetical protein [Nocardioides lianchengensis]SDD74623.1 Protein of unknown function [Nocardioides lianchengensis]